MMMTEPEPEPQIVKVGVMKAGTSVPVPSPLHNAEGWFEHVIPIQTLLAKAKPPHCPEWKKLLADEGWTTRLIRQMRGQEGIDSVPVEKFYQRIHAHPFPTTWTQARILALLDVVENAVIAVNRYLRVSAERRDYSRETMVTARELEERFGFPRNTMDGKLAKLPTGVRKTSVRPTYYHLGDLIDAGTFDHDELNKSRLLKAIGPADAPRFR